MSDVQTEACENNRRAPCFRAEEQEAEREIAELHGIILACHRAFKGGSEFVQSEARRLAADAVAKRTKELQTKRA